MKTDIRAEIAGRRAADVARDGAAQRCSIPKTRAVPLNPFPLQPPVICEIKRCSPSVSNINLDLDPVDQAGRYVASGIRNISVLTEQNYFKGSISDLVSVKEACPEASVLRKDFLLTVEDIEVSYRAGADAVLLIASLLRPELLLSMYTAADSLGLTPLVELHDEDDVRKARGIRPALVGINSRNLKTFRTDRLQPLRTRALIDWDCSVIYESGIKTGYDAYFAAGTGFGGILVGESVVRDSGFAGRLFDSMTCRPQSFRFDFWRRLYRRYSPRRPFVKICGITEREDLEAVRTLGADIAGFILADSPRKVSPGFIESCRDVDILKVGVVVLRAGEDLPGDVARLLRSGALDAVQFHGDEAPSEYLSWPGYKAFRLASLSDAEEAAAAPSPAVLIDAFSREARGGTGRQIEPGLVEKVAESRALWIAGGIRPDNVREVIGRFNPELIDVSSGVESSPGKKDLLKLRALFGGIDE